MTEGIKECCFYNDGLCECEIVVLCKDSHNCYYRQLQQKEQENELLKEELCKKSENEQSFQSLLEEVKTWKEENERLQMKLQAALKNNTNITELELNIRNLQEENKQYLDVLNKIKIGCCETYTRTNECKLFKNMIITVLEGVLNEGD